MNKMNTLAFVKFLLVKLFPTLIHQNFPPSKICAVRYVCVCAYVYIVYVHSYVHIIICTTYNYVCISVVLVRACNFSFSFNLAQ